MLLLEESGLKALNNVIVLIIWNKFQLTTQTNTVVNSWLTTDINYLNNKFKLESKKPIVMSLDEGPTMALNQCSKINIYNHTPYTNIHIPICIYIYVYVSAYMGYGYIYIYFGALL